MKKSRTSVTAAVVAGSLLAGLLAAWLWSGRVDADRTEKRDDLNLYLDASSAGWAEATDQFFAVPESAAKTLGAVATQLGSQREQVALLGETIRNHPALDSAFIGFPDGEFLFVGRSAPPDTGFRTRVITVGSGERVTTLGETDERMVEVSSQIDVSDTYDPTERPWYTPIAAGAAEAWTEPYVFASSQEPGITHSVAVLDGDGELAAVVGVDISLAQLSTFLNELRPGPNGEALVIDGKARVIAASPMNEEPVAFGEGLVPLDESGELAPLIDSLVGDADGIRSARSAENGRTTVARPSSRGSDWYVAIRALDEDFLGDGTANSTENAVGIVGVGVGAAALTALAALGTGRYLGTLRSNANIDELTGLLSRRALKRRLEASLRSGSHVTAAIIDIDRFKPINDEHGHMVGDLVLASLAKRIGEFAASNDADAGRLGGDEFMVVAESDLPWDELNDRLVEPVDVGTLSFTVSASIGVATADQSHQLDADQLMSRADHTLFVAKRDGGNQHRNA